MTTFSTYFCDRCGFTARSSTGWGVLKINEIGTTQPGLSLLPPRDLCPSCTEELKTWAKQRLGD